MTTAVQIIAPRFGDPEVLERVEADLPEPGEGEVRIDVAACGVNPADAMAVSGNHRQGAAPVHPGFEVAGTLGALGPGTEIASGGGTVGDRVVAFRTVGGYASALIVPARDVFAAPAPLTDPEAANLLLVGTTAADLLHEAHVEPGETVLVHGASGAVGVSLLQQAALRDVRVIGTASPGRFDEVRRFGGLPVEYGPGLADRVRELAPDGVAAAFDCAGTDEAVDVSLELVPRPSRVLTIVGSTRARDAGVQLRAGENSRVYRDAVRGELVALAAQGRLVVPVARTWPLAEAAEALRFLLGGHPGGKLALLP